MTRAGQHWLNTGMDSLAYCRDRQHYLSCNDVIDYQFNSRGFRDHEWSGDLQQAIWCVGDSYTVGIGQPFAEIWPQRLSQVMHQRTINISMDGASNAWIARRAQQIIREVRPRVMILHWSFLHRREDDRSDISDELRRIWHTSHGNDLDEFRRCVELVENHQAHTLILHSTIPAFSPDPVVRQVFLRRYVGDRALPDLSHIDQARDGYHYGIRTVTSLVENLMLAIQHQG